MRIDTPETVTEGLDPGIGARSAPVPGKEGLGRGSQAARLGFLGALLFLAFPLAAQEEDPEAEEQSRYRFGFEVKGHYRDTDEASFPSPFPFRPEQLPPGQMGGLLEAVEPGEHTEVSVLTLWFLADWHESLAAKLKVDLIDRYDRNPTSEDREWDVDEAWLRFGRETEPGSLPERSWNAYLKVGKFAKFDRQDDRHLESYGLSATAFNRFEDFGFEGGIDFGRRFYLRASFTAGNPLFFRDPNALAGDNGIEAFVPGAVVNPDPELGSGILIFYETDVEDFDFQHPETGVGVGVRFGREDGFVGGDLLLWAFGRDLADSVDLSGTFYGGDLDLLLGPRNLFPAPITKDDKAEWGANLWLYAGDFSFFGQIVEQDLAGLRRDGWEVEAAWTFELPFFADVFGRQLFSFLQPAVRVSELDNQFRTHPRFPAPSVFWDWEKIDAGLRMGLIDGMIDLTVEWNDNTFVRAGRDESADEFLATVRWEMDWGR